MTRVLVFGNPHLPEDSLAVNVAKELDLNDIDFHITSNLNDLLSRKYEAVLDVAYGIPRVVILDDLEKLREHKLMSLHDYDVAYFLKLMKAMDKIDHVRIIAIPIGYDALKAREEVTALLQSL